MGNIKEIARIAGVSPTTISRVFNKRPYVKEEIRKRVIEVAKKLNYSPKQTARKINLGVLIEGVEEINIRGYESMLLTTIAKHIIKNNFTFEIIPISEIDFIYKNFYDAIISLCYWPETTEKVKGIKDIPVISVNNPISGCYNVYSDHKEGIEIAIDYLVSKGHKRIGFFRKTGKSWGAKERLKGYIERLKKYKVEYDERLVAEEDKNNSILKAIAKICKANPSSLIICGEDSVMEVVHSLYLLNKKIPDDISVISFENIYISQFLTPSHTTISQNFEKIGERVVEIVKKLINGEEIKEKEIIIKNTLIERESVKNLRKEVRI